MRRSFFAGGHASSGSIKRKLARSAANAALRVRFLEKGLRAICRRRALARLSRFGAIAVAFPEVLEGPRLRFAQADGFTLAVNLAEHRGVAAYCFRKPRTSWVLDHLVVSGDTCVDAGANVGLYTCALALRVGREGVVIAIEPHPTAAAFLRRSVAASGLGDRVLIEELALREEGIHESRLYLTQETELASTVVETDRHIDVSATTLDDLIGKHRLDRINFAKIDVERAEAAVLAGGAKLLAQRAIDYIFIELLAQQPAHRLLRAHSYVGFLVLDDPPRLVDANQCPADHFGDYLFLAPDRSSEVSRIPAEVLRWRHDLF